MRRDRERDRYERERRILGSKSSQALGVRFHNTLGASSTIHYNYTTTTFSFWTERISIKKISRDKSSDWNFNIVYKVSNSTYWSKKTSPFFIPWEGRSCQLILLLLGACRCRCQRQRMQGQSGGSLRRRRERVQRQGRRQRQFGHTPGHALRQDDLGAGRDGCAGGRTATVDLGRRKGQPLGITGTGKITSWMMLIFRKRYKIKRVQMMRSQTARVTGGT